VLEALLGLPSVLASGLELGDVLAERLEGRSCWILEGVYAIEGK